MVNRNGIPFVPPKAPRRDCVNGRSGRKKQTFVSKTAAEMFLATCNPWMRENMYPYECTDGHYHLATRREKGNHDGGTAVPLQPDGSGSDAAAYEAQE